jgi:hypothetical protein
MALLNLDEPTARKIYPSAASELKTILEETFGKSFFSEKITDRVKTWPDVLKVLGIPETHFLNSTQFDSPDEIAYKQLKCITRALNEGWIPDWDNNSQYKHYPWFYMDSENGFRLDFVYYCNSSSDVGSRLCFKSEELALYAVAQFLPIYKTFFIL